MIRLGEAFVDVDLRGRCSACGDRADVLTIAVSPDTTPVVRLCVGCAMRIVNKKSVEGKVGS